MRHRLPLQSVFFCQFVPLLIGHHGDVKNWNVPCGLSLSTGVSQSVGQLHNLHCRPAVFDNCFGFPACNIHIRFIYNLIRCHNLTLAPNIIDGSFVYVWFTGSKTFVHLRLRFHPSEIPAAPKHLQFQWPDCTGCV